MNLRQVALWIGFVVLMTSGAYGVYVYLQNPVKSTKPKAQQISVLRQQPPPPPPKPQEKPPEPEIKKEEVKLPDPDPDPEPKQADDQPPPAETLGVDAAGGAGSDGFGLQGRPGGRDITTIGAQTGGGGGGAKFAWFASQVQTHLQDELLRRDKLRKSSYKTVVKVWFTERGTIDRVEVVDGTGNDEIDRTIRSALLEVRPLKQPPPSDMPQPMRLRLSSRTAG